MLNILRVTALRWTEGEGSTDIAKEGLKTLLLTGFCPVNHNNILNKVKSFFKAKDKVEPAFHKTFQHFFDYC